MRILVTGAGGFIGGHLVEHLASTKHEVIACDIKLFSTWSALCKSANNLRVGSGEALKTLGCSPPDLIFHLGSYQPRVRPSFAEPLRYVESNVMDTGRWLAYAQAHGNIPFIYAGSSTGDGDYLSNPYACTKHMGEDLCRLYRKCYDTPTIVTRFYNIYGPREASEGNNGTVIATFWRLWKEGKKLTVIGDGSQSRDFLHVHDLVRGLETIATHFKHALQLSKTHTCIALGSGQSVKIGSLAAAFVDGDRIEYLPKVEGEMEKTLASTLAIRSLGWSPSINVWDYIKELKVEEDA